MLFSFTRTLDADDDDDVDYDDDGDYIRMANVILGPKPKTNDHSQ